jgi:hypothetical protein
MAKIRQNCSCLESNPGLNLYQNWLMTKTHQPTIQIQEKQKLSLISIKVSIQFKNDKTISREIEPKGVQFILSKTVTPGIEFIPKETRSHSRVSLFGQLHSPATHGDYLVD